MTVGLAHYLAPELIGSFSMPMRRSYCSWLETRPNLPIWGLNKISDLADCHSIKVRTFEEECQDISLRLEELKKKTEELKNNQPSQFWNYSPGSLKELKQLEDQQEECESTLDSLRSGKK